ncbi:uncharacterized protein [Lolium perenne]|uniref:uncharacterized protein n=1 Tax=Lolium perenne TaxID=4522 RepID=UPI003A98F40D
MPASGALGVAVADMDAAVRLLQSEVRALPSKLLLLTINGTERHGIPCKFFAFRKLPFTEAQTKPTAFFSEWFASRNIHRGQDMDIADPTVEQLILCCNFGCGRRETRFQEFRSCSGCGRVFLLFPRLPGSTLEGCAQCLAGRWHKVIRPMEKPVST